MTYIVIKINDSWDTFLKECGRESIHHGGYPKIMQCDQRYVEKTIVDWKGIFTLIKLLKEYLSIFVGYVVRVEDYRDSIYKYMHHAVGVLVKMQPTESEFFPDLILALDTEKADQYSELIGNLNRILSFSAEKLVITIISVGNDIKTRHFHIVDLIKGEGFMDVPLHVHEQGRYADKPKFFRGIQGGS